MPRYKVRHDVWPPSKHYVRHLSPIPDMSGLDEVWQYGRARLPAGTFVDTPDWPHATSFEPQNESARAVLRYFIARRSQPVGLPLRPFEDGRVVLDVIVSMRPKISRHDRTSGVGR
jgi:hypothetical protein